MGTIVNAGSLKVGQKIIYQGKLCRVMRAQWVKPGKGGAYAQLTLRYALEGNKTDVRLRSDEKVERATVESVEMEYLYEDGSTLCFMDKSSYEQVFLDKEMVGESIDYLLPNSLVQVEYFDKKPIGLLLPRLVTLTVTETEPTLKTATVTGSPKPATLQTGLSVMVPQFVSVGDKIVVDTETGQYSEKAK